ncbi:SPOR domain-containing protein [Comamonas sp. GB3 AK4-5]|uniref:SPOR domain-containing protein n=1 Tax=Comamonas sp. GB3 AK4-5 TaxID=3231487 RepID=UPI00351E4C36
MLRLSLLVLLLANAGYLAWSQGWMASLGWQPETQSEAFRLKQQMRPETIQVGAPNKTHSPTTPAQATPAPPPVDGPSRCWQAGPFDATQAAQLRQALYALELPSSAWELPASAVPGRWMVYLGKFPSERALEQRRTELSKQGMTVEAAGGTLEPGLSLGRFPTESAATRELTQALRQGVRGARVVQERTEATIYTLRLPQVTPAMHPRVEQLQAALAGKPLVLCTPS